MNMEHSSLGCRGTHMRSAASLLCLLWRDVQVVKVGKSIATINVELRDKGSGKLVAQVRGRARACGFSCCPPAASAIAAATWQQV